MVPLLSLGTRRIEDTFLTQTAELFPKGRTLCLSELSLAQILSATRCSTSDLGTTDRMLRPSSKGRHARWKSATGMACGNPKTAVIEVRRVKLP